MEKFKLIKKNDIYYFKKDNLNILFSYNNLFSLFSKTYMPIQINSKPIINDKKSPMDKISKSIEGMLPKGMELPGNLQDTLKNVINDDKMLGMLKNFGVDSNMVDQLKNFDLNNESLLDDMLAVYSKRADTYFDLIIGKDILDSFIVLVDYEALEITFFSSKEEVGKVIGTTFHIKNLISNNIYLVPNLLTINGKECSVTISNSLKNIFATKDIFNELMQTTTSIPQTKIETDFLGEMGSLNETFFKFDIKAQYFEKEGWIAQLPTMADSMFKGIPNLDLVLPLSFFSKGVLIDGINKKFGYKKL